MNDRMPKKIYLLRVIYSLMAIGQIFIESKICAHQVPIDGGVIAALLIYPHVGHLMFGRFNARRLGQVPFLMDGTVVGILVSTLGFQLIPSVVFASINVFTWMILGGYRLVLAGLLGLVVGILIYPPTVLPMELFGQVCIASNALASMILMTFLAAVGAIIFLRVGELRHAQENLLLSRDTVASARKAAESALLAALPKPIAQMGESAITGGPLELGDALVAEISLLGVQIDGVRSAELDPVPWIASLQILDRTLSRHDLEIVKTYGFSLRVLGLGNDCIDRFIEALIEARTYMQVQDVASLQGAATDGNSAMDLSAAVAFGPAELRIVQPARLNADIFGDAMSSLDTAIHALSVHSPGVVVLSPIAHRKMSPRQDLFPLGPIVPDDGYVALSLRKL